MADCWRWDKGWLDHVAHEQVANQLGVLSVGFVALLRLGILGVSEGNEAGFFKDVDERNPVLADRFQANFLTVVLVKPDSQLLQSLRKEEKRA